MKAFNLVISIILVGLLSACTTTGILIDSLVNPTYFWGQDNGLCGFTRAVDARGDLWDESGCESGELRFSKIGQLDSARLKQLEDAFTNLPTPSEVNCEGTIPPHVFRKRDSSSSTTTWQACGTSTEYYQTTGLEEPFLSIAQLFLQ